MPETDDTTPLKVIKVILFQIQKDTMPLKQWQMFQNLGRYSDFQKDVDRTQKTFFKRIYFQDQFVLLISSLPVNRCFRIITCQNFSASFYEKWMCSISI